MVVNTTILRLAQLSVECLATDTGILLGSIGLWVADALLERFEIFSKMAEVGNEEIEFMERKSIP